MIRMSALEMRADGLTMSPVRLRREVELCRRIGGIYNLVGDAIWAMHPHAHALITRQAENETKEKAA